MVILRLCNKIEDIKIKHEILCENHFEKGQLEDRKSTTRREISCERMGWVELV